MNNQQASYPAPLQDALNCDRLHQAFIIDNQGNEIPITRDMIEKSCDMLSAKNTLHPPHMQN